MTRLVHGCPLCGDQMRDLSSSGIAHLLGREVLEASFLHTSPNLYLTPAPGSLAPGYLILAPRSHYLSFAELAPTIFVEATKIIGAVEALMPELGPYAIFEHGAISDARGSACVSHAHLHIAPCPRPDDLHTALEERFQARSLNALGDLKSFEVTEPYLLLGTERYACYRGEGMESQLLRKIIASQLGCGREWDWRSFPRPEQYFATLRAYASKIEDFRDACLSAR